MKQLPVGRLPGTAQEGLGGRVTEGAVQRLGETDLVVFSSCTRVYDAIELEERAPFGAESG